MTSPQVLEPVVKMKVDELYLTWLSDSSTQSVLQKYLTLIKSGQYADRGHVDASDRRLLNFSENNNVSMGSPCPKSLADRRTMSLCAPSNPLSNPLSSPTLPSGSSGGNAGITETNGRALRRLGRSKKRNTVPSYLCRHFEAEAA
ncbi:hypothetical protein NHX12_006710 [Muraenolepis orangiensis]|uniref:Uncharacterized protein n=1 Tax=Muraenolepis orangiensis TaxID=630683 RepID=A0A9Q0DNM8_9TELE|nr:hypothetical protein NHX12_006710 [Muraenolepis orangiensis]